MSRWSLLALGAAVVVLLFVDALAFHDLLEPHSAKDWLVLVASVLVVAGLASETTNRLRNSGLGGRAPGP
jgi:hypothetical protein